MFTFNGFDFPHLVPPNSARAYAFATFCIAVAAAIRWALGLWFDGVVPFPTFFPAVLLATLVGGFGPGLFAALLAGIIAWRAFLSPTLTFVPLQPGAAISLLIYCATSLLIVWAADHYRRLAKRLEDEQKFRELAVEELAHRLRNKVATIQAIVSFRLRHDPRARDQIISCLGALRATDDLILSAQGRGALIGDMLAAELQPYDASRVSIEGPAVLLPPKLALTMALMFHELATNAAKYGALSVSAGKIVVRWSTGENTLNVEWREVDGPPVNIPDHRGFGTQLLSRALDQFGGKVETNFVTSGLVCQFSIPRSELAPDDVLPTAPAPFVPTTQISVG